MKCILLGCIAIILLADGTNAVSPFPFQLPDLDSRNGNSFSSSYYGHTSDDSDWSEWSRDFTVENSGSGHAVITVDCSEELHRAKIAEGRVETERAAREQVEQELTRVKEQVEEFMRQIRILKRDKEDAEYQIRLINGKLNDMKNEFQKQQDYAADLEIKVQQYKEQIDALTNELESESKARQVAESKVRIIRGQIDKLNVQVETTEATLADARLQIGGLQDELKECNDIKQDEINIRIELEQKLQTLQKIIDELDTNIDNQVNAKDEFRKALNKCRDAAEQCNSDIERCSIENDQFTIIIKQKDVKIQQQNTEIVDLRTTVQRDEDLIGKMQDQIDYITDELNTCDWQLQQAYHQIEEDHQEYTVVVDTYKETISNMQIQIDILQTKLSTCSSEPSVNVTVMNNFHVQLTTILNELLDKLKRSADDHQKQVMQVFIDFINQMIICDRIDMKTIIAVQQFMSSMMKYGIGGCTTIIPFGPIGNGPNSIPSIIDILRHFPNINIRDVLNILFPGVNITGLDIPMTSEPSGSVNVTMRRNVTTVIKGDYSGNSTIITSGSGSRVVTSSSSNMTSSSGGMTSSSDGMTSSSSSVTSSSGGMTSSSGGMTSSSGSMTSSSSSKTSSSSSVTSSSSSMTSSSGSKTSSSSSMTSSSSSGDSDVVSVMEAADSNSDNKSADESSASSKSGKTAKIARSFIIKRTTPERISAAGSQSEKKQQVTSA
ncbi:unnamed protein product [Anisakis simplex]|uniref:t-SNARE coiled-coil homology domain-containing protein n=1 Tax=Anisakis simplex TaxID=6269 RepID=A0A0M3K5K5_ANISI|nr:unnamed protein product [Anisakis simplex]